MKRILVLAIAIIIAHIAFGGDDPGTGKKEKQAKARQLDPAYSVHNYKHPNKAAWAAKNKKQSSDLDNANVAVTDDYKHPLSRRSGKKAVASPYKGNGYPASSYKHPLGVAGV
jgi:hypothetical protein